MNLRIFDSPEELDRALARTIVQRIAAIDRPAIALSGGSTPVALYRMLGASPWKEQLAAKPVTWVVVDERYVPATDPQSNAKMIRETLFANGMSQGHQFLDFKTHFADAHDSARQFEADWRDLALSKLDIVVLGVGDDGHTASLFPGTGALEVEEGIATAVFVPRLSQWRVTLTLPVIREAGLRIVQVTGESKAGIVRDAKEGVDHPIVRTTAGVESWWFLDEAAARLVRSEDSSKRV